MSGKRTENLPSLVLEVLTSTHVNEKLEFLYFWVLTKKLFSGTKSNWLMKAIVDEMSFDGCQDSFGYVRNLNEIKLPDNVRTTQLCARDTKDPPSDSCKGDSGSAMHVMGNDKRYHAVGVVSFGMTTCGSKFPSVYTRVSQYIDWIENIVWPIHGMKKFN